MRYYDIQLQTKGGGPVQEYTSHPAGLQQPPDRGALNVEMDIFSAESGPDSKTTNYLKIWGVDFKTISNATNLNGANITVSAGMGKGLPLANPAQAGKLLVGVVQQAFSNWQGTEMSLDVCFYPAVGSAIKPLNGVLNWPAGTPLSGSLGNTLTTMFPGFTQAITISPNIVAPVDQVAYFSSVSQLASWVRRFSMSVLGGNYTGVSLSVDSAAGKIVATDSTQSASNPKKIAFSDLIGQPRWIEATQVRFFTVLRADIKVNDFVQLPNTPSVTTAQAFAGLQKTTSAQQGLLRILEVHHIGNFRQADAMAWITTFRGTTIVNSTASAGSAAP